MSTQTQEQFIPLNRLKKSPKNVRKTPHGEADIEALAASIEAKGLLQNLVVEPELDGEGCATGYYLVNIGEGRRQAQLLRAQRGQIGDDAPIRCMLDTDHDGREISLAENVIRSNMHPADQFEAFRDLIDAGRSIEDVAARFGVTPLVVARRLKLANVHPSFIALYRSGKITLEHLMALSITEDHERQQQVWKDLKSYERHPESLRRALTEGEISLRDPLARFVSVKVYTKAGGGVRRDLFSEDDDGYVTDTELLRRLATEKLEKRAEEIKRKEGHAWVEAQTSVDYATLAAYGRVRVVMREPTEVEQAQLAAITKAREEIRAEAAATNDETHLTALDERRDVLAEAEDAIDEARRVPHPEQQALAGAIVSIERDGKLRIERGLLKPEDAKRFARAERTDTPASSEEAPRTHSAALLRRLTAHRTIALQATLARRPDVALVALTHRLACRTFFEFDRTEDVLQIDVRRTPLEQFAADVKESKAAAALDAQRQALATALPTDPEALLPWLLQQPQSDLLALLAFCVALSADAVQADEAPGAVDAIAQAAGFDMREWWSATAASYFGSIPRARVLEVVGAAVSPEAAATLGKLKKAALVQAAEQKVAGTGWLPSFLRNGG